MLRTALALAAITGRDSVVRRVRARRVRPGLAPQHIAAARVVAALCDAQCEGLGLASTEIVFRPGRIRSGEFHLDVGTAGSLALVLQAALPVALLAPGPVRLRLNGGTDVKSAPPIDYFSKVLFPLLRRMGAAVDVQVRRRGYYPRGGGRIEVEVHPARLRAFVSDVPGALESLGGVVHVANLPAHILERMDATAAHMLRGMGPLQMERHLLGPDAAEGPGGAIVLWAQREHSVLGAAEVAQRGVPAEQLAAAAAGALRTELSADVTLDIHAADQILIYAALAEGTSRFSTRYLSSHAATTLWLLQRYLETETRQESVRRGIHLQVRGTRGLA